MKQRAARRAINRGEERGAHSRDHARAGGTEPSATGHVAHYAAYSTTDHKTRLGAYAQAMEGVSERYPDDRRAKIFYALALIALGLANPTDTTFTYREQADAILEPLFKLDREDWE